jgi:hypothetical protein
MVGIYYQIAASNTPIPMQWSTTASEIPGLKGGQYDGTHETHQSLYKINLRTISIILSGLPK